MIRLQYIFFIFFISFSNGLLAQDTLPKITVRNISNKIIVSWKNTYGANISNINIQRSYDSIKNFTTIGSVLEPMNRENGFVDNKAPTEYVFYRVFVAFEGGRYVFSKSSRPVKDSTVMISNPVIVEDKTGDNPAQPQIAIPAPSTAPVLVPGTKIGIRLLRVPAPLPLPPPPTPKNIFIPSKFIYTGKDNNIIIELPVSSASRFSAKFYDEEDNPIFEIKKITEAFLIIEKVNFKHAGWFYFKLFDNGILKEKNRFYIPKDGRTGIPPNEIHRSNK